LEFEAEWEALGVTGQDQGPLVDGDEEVLNGLAFGTIRCRGESHADGLIGNGDPARRREYVRDDLLRLPRTPRVWSNQRCEFRLHVRTDNTDHVDDPLELPRVADELASEYGLLNVTAR